MSTVPPTAARPRRTSGAESGSPRRRTARRSSAKRQHHLHIRVVMGEGEPRAGRRHRLDEARGRNHAVLQQHVLDPAELPDGEAMAGRQRDGVVRVEDDRKCHGRGLQSYRMDSTFSGGRHSPDFSPRSRPASRPGVRSARSGPKSVAGTTIEARDVARDARGAHDAGGRLDATRRAALSGRQCASHRLPDAPHRAARRSCPVGRRAPRRP